MKKIKVIIAIVLEVLVINTLKAQVDPHFSQYYAYPLWLNPALTGVIDGDTRINANFKNQWAGISNGYRTGALSMDFTPTEKVGLGLNVIDQAAGTAGYNYFGAYGSFAYGVSVSADGTKMLRFGLQAGVINRSFDPGKLQLDDQYNPLTGFDPAMPSFENLATNNATVFDASAGVFYYDSDPLKNANVFGGVSLAHLTRAKDPFATDQLNSPIPIRLTIHAGVRIKASDFLDVTPHAIFVQEQNNQIRAFGIYSEMKFEESSGMILGAMYRLNDAAVADVGYHLNNMVIGLSYDINTSALKAATNSQGGFELSISYVFKKRTKNPSLICPRF